MRSDLGTPKSLRQAIRNGLSEDPTLKDEKLPILAELIELHVRDYLSQKFGASMMLAKGGCSRILSDLWFRVTGKT